MVHYTHLTKIKAYHTHQQSYMQALNLKKEKKKKKKKKKNDDHEEKKEVNTS